MRKQVLVKPKPSRMGRRADELLPLDPRDFDVLRAKAALRQKPTRKGGDR
jgi:hypothetical protein